MAGIDDLQEGMELAEDVVDGNGQRCLYPPDVGQPTDLGPPLSNLDGGGAEIDRHDFS